MSRKVIKFWTRRQGNFFLSNFYSTLIVLKDRKWGTSEHYYQAMKFKEYDLQEEIRNLRTPKQAANMGRRKDLPLRSDWEEVKEDIMREVVWEKFNQNHILKKCLIDTGNAVLIEDSPYDYYWGCGKDNSGKNRLGIILMEIRDKLIS